MAVARPIPVRAPVMRITLFFIGNLFFGLIKELLRNWLRIVFGPGSDVASETGHVTRPAIRRLSSRVRPRAVRPLPKRIGCRHDARFVSSNGRPDRVSRSFCECYGTAPA